MNNEQLSMNKQSTGPKRRVNWRRIFAILALLVISVVLRACLLRPGTNYPGSYFNRGHNAAWLGVEWSMEPHTTAEVAALAADLQQRQIDTIFVYVSYLKPAGKFNPTYDHARDFAAAFKQAAPQIEVQAWLGIPVKAPPGAPLASGDIDLNDTTIQQTIVDFSRSAVEDWGFDGVHLDPEPIGSDDRALLKLLREMRSALGENKHLSIAVPARLPAVGEIPLLSHLVWSKEYYTAVASEVDSIAVMTYDSAMPAAILYRSWLQLQVVSLTQVFDGTRAHVYIGIPTSEETTGAHLPWAENIRAGLGGVVAGLNDSASHPDVITGIAIYPYWETTDDEWQTYKAIWLGQTE